jgi:hypothetical protein
MFPCCRPRSQGSALNHTVELAIIDFVHQKIKETTLVADSVPTKKNALVRDFFADMEFVRITGPGDGHLLRWTLDLVASPGAQPKHFVTLNEPGAIEC